MYLPIINTWRLNERHYGALQGLNKQETVDKYGKDQVLIWRRSYDIPPPELDESSIYYPGNDKRYANIPKDELPKTESLKLTEDRFMVDWHKVFVPIIRNVVLWLLQAKFSISNSQILSLRVSGPNILRSTIVSMKK
jgi:2,3-bisphosphoglycerate-dependent phosphoglycerate mutase